MTMHEAFGSLDLKGPLCACQLRGRAAFKLTQPTNSQRNRLKTPRIRAAGDNGEQDSAADKDNHKSKKKKTAVLDDFNPVKLGRRSRAALNQLLAVAEKADKSKRTGSDAIGTKEDPGIGAVNPIKLGRKSRAVLDNLWEQFASITSPTRSVPVTPQFSSAGEGLTEFETPQAAFTTVLVVGASGRIGRVLVRKLLLRGYKVKAMLRPRLNEDGEIDLERPLGIPQSVEIVYGDVSEYASCRAAAEGVDKIVYAAKSKSTYNIELNKVEVDGPFLLAKAMMDVQNRQAQIQDLLPAGAKRSIADFDNGYDHTTWKVTHLGGDDTATEKAFDRGQNMASTNLNKHGNLRFKGAVYTRYGKAEAGSPLMEHTQEELADCEGLVVRVRGDGQVYSIVLTTGTGATYVFRFPTKRGYSNIRMPFNAFRPTLAGEPPLESNHINLAQIALRFEPDGRNLSFNTPKGSRQAATKQLLAADDDPNKSFDVEVDWIRALPGGDESDFIMVGCAGIPQAGADIPQHEKLMAAKRRGENLLKNTGLGYTVIRAGPLLEEPGGYRALIFDQGNRITQGISCADVADVCVKSLHDTAARNKTFEVCYEYTPEKGLEMYELVAHLPDKSNNYLGPALAGLRKNT
ncbi:hypothetical protein ABBQ38_010886 [Trebouxia sp. C0009 RCD-2024]